MVWKGCATRWYEYVRDHPNEAYRPRRLSDEDTAFEVWMMAPFEFDGMVTIHRWRATVTHDDRRAYQRAYLQPPPYLMLPTLEAARAQLPPSATKLGDVPLPDRYSEAWLL